MKTKFTLVALLTVGFFYAQAQQPPNAGFNTWDNSYTPTGYMTNDALFGSALGFTFQDNVDFVEGTSSLELKSDSLSFAPSAGVVSDIVSSGTGTYSPNTGPQYSGVPFAFRPDTIFFDYKYTSPGTDTGALSILLSKNFSTVVLGVGIPLDTTSQWISAYAVVTSYYQSAVIPDTLILQFLSSYGIGTKGSTLHIDGVRFGYVHTATEIAAIANETRVNVYPNPASTELNISVSDNVKGSAFEAFDLTGRLVSKTILENPSSSVDISKLSNGTYIYRISDANNLTVSQNKFVVVK
ncbi:MAG: hypothetical protein JWO06_1109 [Bacteroidota bacterium]|nr:hypothetical protein [Bacteroidota bacterium]